MGLTLDHIVIGAADLARGRAWALHRLGAEPLPGGRHALMGTHNLLVRLDDPDAREQYLEIIAVDPDAQGVGRPRWFDLDEPQVQTALEREPTLLAWVARSDDIDADRDALARAGVDPGPLVDASRDTADGLLRWRITIPISGARVANGAVPMLISWPGRHPVASLPPSGVSLVRVTLRGISATVAADLLMVAALVPGHGPALEVTLHTAAGLIDLSTVA
jgi:Glyoxalase-like domain